MGYRCNCPEYEERPCDNLNEELECEECQHGKPEESEEQKRMRKQFIPAQTRSMTPGCAGSADT